MRQNRKIKFCEIVFVCIMVLTGCSSRMNSVDQDRSSGKIVGKINTVDGAPVRNATVKMISVDFSPDQAKNADGILSATTDGTGQYSFSVENSGLYSINAEKDGLYSFQDSVYGSEKEQVEAGTSTLKVPGSISGIARLNNPDDNRSIIILVLGTTTYCQPFDTTGVFVINNLAEGLYRLKLLSSIRGYNVLDTTVLVAEGKQTVLNDPLQLVRSGLPGVGPVKAEFNKAMQIVTLTWPPIDTTDVQGLYVFRNATVAGKPHMILKKTTTQFIDDIPDTSMTGDTLSYIVVAYGANDKIGPVGTPQKIRIDGGISLKKSIPIEFYSDFPNGNFTSIAVDNNLNLFLCNDGKILKIDSTGKVTARYFDGHVWDGYIYQPVLTLDKNGNCYFVNTRSNKVIRFSNNLEIQRSFSDAINSSMTLATYVDNEFLYISDVDQDRTDCKTWIFNSDLEFKDSILCTVPGYSLLLHQVHSGRMLFEMWSGGLLQDILCIRGTDFKNDDLLNFNQVLLQLDSIFECKSSRFSEYNFQAKNEIMMLIQFFAFDNGSMILVDNCSNAYIVNKKKHLTNRYKLKKYIQQYNGAIVFSEPGRLCYFGDRKNAMIYEMR